MGTESPPPTEPSLAALLSGILTDAKAMILQEWTLAKREVHQELRQMQRAALALGSGAGVAVIGGLLLIGMLVLLLAAWTKMPLWGCYGLIGGTFALVGGILVARGKAHITALDRVLPQTRETLQGSTPRQTEQPAVEGQPRVSSSPVPGRAGQPPGGAPALNATALWKLLTDTFTEWNEDKPFQLAAALSYYTLFSLAPLLIIALAVAGLFFGREATQHQIMSTMQGLVGPQGAEAIQGMIQNASTPSSGILATIVGVVTLLIGAGGVVGQLQDSLNTVWGVAPKPGLGLMGLIRARFLSLALVLGLGFLLVVSLVVSTALTAVLQVVGGVSAGESVVWQGIELLVSFGFLTLLFALIYKILPDVHMAWKDVWIGAAITAVLFTLGKFLIGLYVGQSGTSSAYGAAGSLIVVLVWVYYSALIVFFGAEFTQVYANTYGAGVTPDEHAMAVSKDKQAPAKEEQHAKDTATLQ